MRIAVIGATGNIGTSVVELLGRDDRITDILGMARRLPGWRPPKTTFRSADIRTDALAASLAGVDAVVHLAWLFQPSHRPSVTWESNVVGSSRVFDAVAAAGVPALVYSSSVGAYSPGPPGGRRVDESWPTHAVPTSAYSREKAYVERLLDTFERAHPAIRVVRIRPGFVFKRSAATSQRRLFAGPLLPNALVRRGRLPVLPVPPGVRFQAVHSLDLADAFHRAVVTDVRGPFNVAAEPEVDAAALADALGARPVTVPRPVVRTAVAALWRAHLVPTDPGMLDLLLGLPLLDTARAARELGWTPRRSALDAVAEMLRGMAAGAGGPTPPLAPDTAATRVEEVLTGVGERP